MDANKTYITEITKHDLKEIAEAANAYQGDGISINRTQAGMMIGLDLPALERMIKNVIDHGSIYQQSTT